jgi:nitrite reductase/ring-hydroxylating ferredoxin subunit
VTSAGDPAGRVVAGSVDDLKARGFLTAKVGNQPVCIWWHDGKPYALQDRCPHLGFPLHRGTVESGMVTCHWHHARFDLCSGGTLDPFADDARSYPVEVQEGVVVVGPRPDPWPPGYHRQRLEEGLEQGLTLVMAKAVLAMLEGGASPAEVVRAGVEFGCRNRAEGWGSGLTVLTAMANVLPHLWPVDRPLALVQGLAFVSRNTMGQAPRFPLQPLASPAAPPEQLAAWYRRFIETRSADAAERALATAIAGGMPLPELAGMMAAAVTDHVFVDEGHTIDFTNKAFEVLGHLGEGAAGLVLPTLVAQTATARRHEEEAAWRHPHNLAGLAAEAASRLPSVLAGTGREAGAGVAGGQSWAEPARGEAAAASAMGKEPGGAAAGLAWVLLGEDPVDVVEEVLGALARGVDAEAVARAVALAAALRIVRFHVQNDHGDWDVVHHGFTSANAVHQLVVRAPEASPVLLRGVVQVALKVFLDRFLNVPPARPPTADHGDLEDLGACFDQEGRVDEAGSIVYGYLRAGGDRARLEATLGHALLVEDAGFHWFQVYEAALRQSRAWPEGSEESALVLVGLARFLAAHTPTRRELSQVVRIATRLHRGEAVHEE